MTGLTLHSATTVVPIASPPIPGGAVAVRDGVVVAVGQRRELRWRWPAAAERHWDGVLLPGLVNAHTHLEYGVLAAVGRQRHYGFAAWAAAFDAAHAAVGDPGAWGPAARRGAADALASGTTCIADVVAHEEALGTLGRAGVAGVTYVEAMGFDADAWRDGGRVSVAARLEAAAAGARAPARVGLSPHAPYSLDAEVMTDLASLAREWRVRLHTHVAESALEERWVTTGDGGLAEMLRAWGWRIAPPPAGRYRSAVALLDACGVLGPDCHVAHGVTLDGQDRALLRRRGVSVALCARSNLAIGVEPPPVAALLAEGNAICVGTDSLGSVPSLDLLAELPVLAAVAREHGRHDDGLEQRLVEAATAGGARALGLDRGEGRVGVLAPGARADFAVFGVEPEAGESVEHALVECGAGSCVATALAGLMHAAVEPV